MLIAIFSYSKFFKSIYINRTSKTKPLSIINRIYFISNKKIIPSFISISCNISNICNSRNTNFRSNRKKIICYIIIIINSIIIKITKIYCTKRNFFFITIIFSNSNYKTIFNIISKCTFNFTIIIFKIVSILITISTFYSFFLIRSFFSISKYLCLLRFITTYTYKNKFIIARNNSYNRKISILSIPVCIIISKPSINIIIFFNTFFISNTTTIIRQFNITRSN